MSNEDNPSEFDADAEEVSPLSSGVIAEDDEVVESFVVDDDDEDYTSPLAGGILEDEESEDSDEDFVGSDVVVTAEESAELDTDGSQLSVDEARELTEHIRSTADVLYVLVARAHAGKAHKALGYSSFEAYVKEEFNISKSRAYQFINQANIIAAIEQAAPEGTQFKLSEAAARDLKNYVDELAPAVQEATAGLSPDEAGAVVEDLVNDFRGRGDELNDFELDLDDDFLKSLEDIEVSLPESNGGGGEGGGGSQFDEMPGFDSLDTDEDWLNAQLEGMPDLDGVLGGGVEENSKSGELETLYSFYEAVGKLSNFPDPEKVIASINPLRATQINAELPKALAWLNDFSEKWFSRDGADASEGEGVDIDVVSIDDSESVDDADEDEDFVVPAEVDVVEVEAVVVEEEEDPEVLSGERFAGEAFPAFDEDDTEADTDLDEELDDDLKDALDLDDKN